MISYKPYFAIEKRIKNLGVNVHRSELIHSFTEGKKESLKALNEWEYKEFLKWLKSSFNLDSKKPWQGTPEDKMRKKMIQLFVHEMNYTMKGLNDWCIKFGCYHKPLNDHDKNELSKILSIAKEKVYPNYMKNVTS